MRYLLTFIGFGMLLCGCAPARFEPAVSYYADQAQVRDASARRVKDYWYLRFNELILSDLDDAMRATDETKLRQSASLALRAAASLGDDATTSEIARMRPADLAGLAKRAQTPAQADALSEAYRKRSAAALAELLRRVASEPAGTVTATLRQIRSHVEPAPDDKGRGGRKLALAWASPLSKAGLNKVEKDREQQLPDKLATVYDEAALYQPQEASGNRDDLQRYAPLIVIEWPAQRDWPAQSDRFGEVYLTGEARHVDVNINTSRPMLYAYRTEAKIFDQRYEQLVYVWWYPERPAMTKDDPAAGHIDGDTLRITFDRHGHPAIFEVVQSCGCGHLVFVSDEIEQMARKEYGGPEARKKLCIERAVSGKHDLVVAGQFHLPEKDNWHPFIYVLAGYHEVTKLELGIGDQKPNLKVHETHSYGLADYDRLEHLPLGDGLGSMFGADGLVHNAGRKEGVLLAPTGIMSAGQPRKRGTQKIRWDDFSFDDPRLLENTLRLPHGM